MTTDLTEVQLVMLTAERADRLRRAAKRWLRRSARPPLLWPVVRLERAWDDLVGCVYQFDQSLAALRCRDLGKVADAFQQSCAFERSVYERF